MPGPEVGDVVAHLAGLCEDGVDGDLASDATDTWTAAQVNRCDGQHRTPSSTAVAGRRSAAQVASWSWPADPAPLRAAGIGFAFTWAATDVRD